MLALTLRSLERDGLLTREAFPEVLPRVEYERKINEAAGALRAEVNVLLAHGRKDAPIDLPNPLDEQRFRDPKNLQ